MYFTRIFSGWCYDCLQQAEVHNWSVGGTWFARSRKGWNASMLDRKPKVHSYLLQTWRETRKPLHLPLHEPCSIGWHRGVFQPLHSPTWWGMLLLWVTEQNHECDGVLIGSIQRGPWWSKIRTIPIGCAQFLPKDLGFQVSSDTKVCIKIIWFHIKNEPKIYLASAKLLHGRNF